MISKSKDCNENYLAQIVKLKNVKPHSNADRLQVVDINFQQVITGLDAKDGDLYVFFPLEVQINSEFLSWTNSYNHSNLNADQEASGFFCDKGRVKAMKLRGEKSMGYIVPISVFKEFLGVDLSTEANTMFDTIGEFRLCKKYEIRKKNQEVSAKQGKSPQASRLVDGQVKFHVSTSNLRYNANRLSPDDIISVTYKTHGTSFHCSNLLVKKELSIFEKIMIKLGIDIKDTKHDIVYGSRRTVKNERYKTHTQDFYGGDLWGVVAKEIGDLIPKGYSLYGEILGYTPDGGSIQGEFDYGCKACEHRVQIYRITNTNEDGFTTELSTSEIVEFCEKTGLEYVHLFYSGRAGDMFEIDEEEHWNESFVKTLEDCYNEKACFMCKNTVPEEGVVLRRESLFHFDVMKLKSFNFLQKESDQLDTGEVDIESEN